LWDGTWRVMWDVQPVWGDGVGAVWLVSVGRWTGKGRWEGFGGGEGFEVCDVAGEGSGGEGLGCLGGDVGLVGGEGGRMVGRGALEVGVRGRVWR
jgi:hypothetical protein